MASGSVIRSILTLTSVVKSKLFSEKMCYKYGEYNKICKLKQSLHDIIILGPIYWALRILILNWFYTGILYRLKHFSLLAIH